MASEREGGSGGWWSRECGGREVLAIALPLVISTGSFSVMLFVDRMFLLWHSASEMAAAMPAGMLYWTAICFPLGIAAFVNTFVAQYHGAGRAERIGLVSWQGFRVGLYATPLFLCAIPLAPWLFRAAGHPSPVVEYEVIYFQILMCGGGAAVMSEALAAFFTGRGVTRVVMYVNVAAAVVNIALDYAWIFGYFGLPEAGIVGAAWATVISTWFKLACFWWLIHRPATRRAYQLDAGRRLDAPLLRRVLFFGAPNGLQFLVECSAFTLMMLGMGRFGETALAATTLAFNVNAVAFIPMIGVAIAVSALVGRELTRGRPHLAARATWTALVLALAYNGLFVVAYLCFPDVLMMGHAAGVSPGEFAVIRDLTVVLLRFVAAFCLFDAMQLLFAAAIKGAGDTWFVLRGTTLLSGGAVLVGWLGARYGGGLLWWWLVVTGWVCALGVTFLVRFLQGRWRRMRVIEVDLGEAAPQWETDVALRT